jgi:GT2 family glycosyltransferase
MGLPGAQKKPEDDDNPYDRDDGSSRPHPGSIADTRPSVTAPAMSSASRVSIVVPNWNGAGWLPALLGSIARQTRQPCETIVVDNGSVDGSLELLQDEAGVTVIALDRNTGFASAANRGFAAARGELVALLNADIVLEPDWLERMENAISAPGVASVACKMMSLRHPGEIYDAGDVLRRDGVCEQRGRFESDDGRFDETGEVFGACAGAALYRRDAVLEVGGFDLRYFAYLEDVDLALRLRMAGWTCRYEPVVAHHAGESSSPELDGGHVRLVQRNTLLLVAKAFPPGWLGLVLYRQLGWARHAVRTGTARAHLRGAIDALPALPGALRARRRLRSSARVPVQQVVAPRPIRGPAAGGHRSRHARPVA